MYVFAQLAEDFGAAYKRTQTKNFELVGWNKIIKNFFSLAASNWSLEVSWIDELSMALYSDFSIWIFLTKGENYTERKIFLPAKLSWFCNKRWYAPILWSSQRNKMHNILPADMFNGFYWWWVSEKHLTSSIKNTNDIFNANLQIQQSMTLSRWNIKSCLT